MSETLSQRPVLADADDWAPVGWTPADTSWSDDAPFGSVLGDPLMGSPVFDVSVLDDGSRPPAENGVTGAASGGSLDGPHAEELRAQMERQQRAMRQEVVRPLQAPPVVPEYGRAPAGAAGRLNPAGQNPRGQNPAGQALSGQYAVGRNPYPQGQYAPRTAPTDPYGRQPGAAVNRPVDLSRAQRRQPLQQQGAARRAGRQPSAARVGGTRAPERRPTRTSPTTSGSSRGPGSFIGWIVLLFLIFGGSLFRQ